MLTSASIAQAPGQKKLTQLQAQTGETQKLATARLTYQSVLTSYLSNDDLVS